MDVPEYWFNIYFELHTARPHGALCDGVHMGIQALPGHTARDRRKSPTLLMYIVSSLSLSSAADRLPLRLGGAATIRHRLVALVAVPTGARRCQRAVH